MPPKWSSIFDDAIGVRLDTLEGESGWYFCASFDACLGCVVLIGLELWCVAFL